MEYLNQFREEVITSITLLTILIVIRYLVFKGVKKVAKLGDLDHNRTRLILKYVNIVFWLTLFAIAGVIWSVNLQEVGVLLSSIFAVIGVALFASWSILSNITAGVILFFSFPFKIGDRIRIQDKDFPTEAVIEDIRAFHLLLRTEDKELITYPNNLLLQKGVVLLHKAYDEEGSDAL